MNDIYDTMGSGISLQAHVDKICTLERLVEEHEATKHEVGSMREMLTRAHLPLPLQLQIEEGGGDLCQHGGSMMARRRGSEDEYDSDSGVRSVCTVTPKAEEEQRAVGQPKTPEPTGHGLMDDEHHQNVYPDHSTAALHNHNAMLAARLEAPSAPSVDGKKWYQGWFREKSRDARGHKDDRGSDREQRGKRKQAKSEGRVRNAKDARERIEKDRARNAMSESAVAAAWTTYEKACSELMDAKPTKGKLLSSNLTFYDIPWPVLGTASTFHDLTTQNIAAFPLLLHHSQGKSRYSRLHTAVLIRHPDTFTQKILPRIAESHCPAAIAVVNVAARISAPADQYYGHEDTAKMCARFITHLFSCPDVPPATSQSAVTPSLAHFVTYALHCTHLHSSVTFCVLYLLSRLKNRFPAARGSSGHRLYISAFMIASKVICDDTYSNKS
ncbi:hypothetical protein FRC08_001231 [Ceratobasidium sp. 394]|nr:hypothetical protein FRC08_001231 [Ceratobasidium sp. 394]